MSMISKKLDAHFAAVAAAAAGAAAIGGANEADAAIVYSGVVNLNIPSTFGGVYLNVVTGANAGATFAGFDVNPYGATYLRLFTGTGGGVVDTDTTANINLNLAPGTVIGAVLGGGAVWDTGTANPVQTTWNLNSSNNIVGFRFVNEAMANQVQYGWMRIALGSSAGAQTRSIVEWAYEDSGGDIAAGAVPAPGALALLALGGLVGGRRRKVA